MSHNDTQCSNSAQSVTSMSQHDTTFHTYTNCTTCHKPDAICYNIYCMSQYKLNNIQRVIIIAQHLTTCNKMSPPPYNMTHICNSKSQSDETWRTMLSYVTMCHNYVTQCNTRNKNCNVNKTTCRE